MHLLGGRKQPRLQHDAKSCLDFNLFTLLKMIKAALWVKVAALNLNGVQFI